MFMQNPKKILTIEIMETVPNKKNENIFKDYGTYKKSKSTLSEHYEFHWDYLKLKKLTLTELSEIVNVLQNQKGI